VYVDKSVVKVMSNWQTGAVVDHAFADADLAGMYDAFCAGRSDFDFYLPLVMSATSVLDVGCGTGELLRRARARGHRGRLCGLDPAVGMLAQARTCPDVEWTLGDLGCTTWGPEFDLVVMTGHAFQVLVTDEELRAALATIRSVLTADGRFVFETRNPLARAWQRWTPEYATDTTVPDGTVVRMAHQVRTPVEGDLVRFTATFTSPGWPAPRTSRSTLRFLDVDSLSALLTEAGLAVAEQFGDWDRRPLSAADPEIITVARRATTAG
jgi:ubiquinone/menaquinone biosynthesis C-methylase UbiE